jgi:hypothetical protein
MVPEWMEAVDENGNPTIKNNGVWTNTTLNIPELIATYMKVWFEDSVPTDLIEGIKSSAGNYTSEKQKEVLIDVYTKLFEERKQEFNNMLARATEEVK